MLLLQIFVQDFRILRIKEDGRQDFFPGKKDKQSIDCKKRSIIIHTFPILNKEL